MDLTNLDSIETRNHLLRDSLSFFYELAFAILAPGHQYYDSWYIDYLCEYLKAFENKEIQRLSISMPPRFGKTALCNIAFSTRYLGLHPEARIVSISYSAKISQNIHAYSRAITNSSWFKDAFPDFSITNKASDYVQAPDSSINEAKNTQSMYATTRGGYRLATSVGGSITGLGGSILICDDIISPSQALSIAENKAAMGWISSNMWSRLDNQKTGQILAIQQRLNDNDFVAKYVNETDWVVVKVPVQARETKLYRFGNITKLYKKGEFLQPERLGEKELNVLMYSLGKKTIEAQYFQETVADDGEVFKKEWFRYYTYLPRLDYLAIYADTAVKEGRLNDYSVFQCWGVVTRNNRQYAYLVDTLRGKWRAPILRKKAVEFWDKWLNNDRDVPLRKMAIEDKASGSGLIQDLQEESNIPIVSLLPEKDKVARANDILPRLEAGQVLFPKEAEFLFELEKELLLFSAQKNSNKKDQVDTLTYAIKDIFYSITDNKKAPIDYRVFLQEGIL